MRVTCPKQKNTCRGRLTIGTASAVKTSAKRKKITLGSRRFAVKPGKSQTVKVKVTKTGKKVVKRYKRLQRARGGQARRRAHDAAHRQALALSPSLG